MRIWLSLLLVGALAAACGSDEGGTANPPGSGGSGGSAAADASAGAAGSGAGSGGTIDAGGGDAAAYGCSADLRRVVDANGATIETCASDKGCAGGVCIPACDAAAQSGANFGCEFRVPTPGTYSGFSAPPCYAIFVANTWPEPAKLSVSYAGGTLDVTLFGRMPVKGQPESAWPPVPATGLPPDQVAVLFMSSDPNSVFIEKNFDSTCPIKPAIDASTFLDGTGKTQAFRLTSSAPVSAYDIVPYGGALSHVPGAQLLYPVSVWGTNHVVIAPPPGTHSPPGPLWLQVLGRDDATSVTLLPSVDLPAGGGLVAAPKGAAASFSVNANEALQWQLASTSNDPSGTIIDSTQPVAVFAGNRFLRLQPTPAPGGEAAHQQVLPVSALASEYVAAPYATRRADLADEDIDYRIVGVVNGTTLSYDPPVPGAPATLNLGQVADFVATGPFRVKSQGATHPFLVAQLMDTANIPGGSRPGATAPSQWGPNLGDEDFVVLPPPAQFLQRYVFFSDPSYPTTNLVLTRTKAQGKFHDVTVECLGVVGGWKPVGTEGLYEVTDVDLIRADIPVKTCGNGRQAASSDGPFGVIVWGLDAYSSYSYPAGGNAAQLTTVKVPAVPK